MSYTKQQQLHKSNNNYKYSASLCINSILILLVSYVAFLPGCLPLDDRVQKSATSESSAQQMALCNSFCVNRVTATLTQYEKLVQFHCTHVVILQTLSGDFALTAAQKQVVYPVHMATIIIILAESCNL